MQHAVGADVDEAWSAIQNCRLLACFRSKVATGSACTSTSDGRTSYWIMLGFLCCFFVTARNRGLDWEVWVSGKGSTNKPETQRDNNDGLLRA